MLKNNESYAGERRLPQHKYQLPSCNRRSKDNDCKDLNKAQLYSLKVLANKQFNYLLTCRFFSSFLSAEDRATVRA
jgi:hypothetical protein